MPKIIHKILVIDDDAADRLLIQRALSSLNNIEITETDNGTKALEILESLNPALVITDIFMPQMDGLAFLTALASRKFTFPVIAISGQGYESRVDFLSVAQKFGAVTSLTKDQIKDDLAGIVNNYLDLNQETCNAQSTGK